MNEDLKLGDKLAVGRTILAMDRTLMAWVRTSLSLISFGFTIYKFLQSLASGPLASRLRPQAPRNIGLFLVTVGTLSLGLALAQFWMTMEKKLGVTRRRLLLNPSLLLAMAICLLGLFLLIAMLARLT